MRIAIVVFLLLVLALGADAADLKGLDVTFGASNQYHGYLVKPSGDGPFPALMVIHEWWGLNDYIKNQSDMLANAGYVALAIDLFGKDTTDMNEAMKMVKSLDQQAATDQEVSAANYLRAQPFVKSDRVGGIGWCFGGAQCLNLAINDPKLRVAVIYYGPPVTDPAVLSKIRARIIGFYGEADQSIPMSRIKEFRGALKLAKVKADIITYKGAGHAFANPTRGPAYNPEAAADAWTRTLHFLDKFLAK